MPKKAFTLSDQLALLFDYVKNQGLSTTFRAIAEATGESPNNLQKIVRGDNANPGLRTLTAIAAYFGVSLSYFDCKTEIEAQIYLRNVEKQKMLGRIAMRAEELSPEGQAAIEQMIDYVRKAEAKTQKKK